VALYRAERTLSLKILSIQLKPRSISLMCESCTSVSSVLVVNDARKRTKPEPQLCTKYITAHYEVALIYPRWIEINHFKFNIYT
jgi:hypothetical protein